MSAKSILDFMDRRDPALRSPGRNRDACTPSFGEDWMWKALAYQAVYGLGACFK
jgi:hypothetical protein